MTGIDYIAFAIAGLMIAALVKSLHSMYLDEKRCNDEKNAKIIKQAEDQFWKDLRYKEYIAKSVEYQEQHKKNKE